MMFKAIWPEEPIVMVPGANHYVPEDAPEVALAVIEQFVQATP